MPSADIADIADAPSDAPATEARRGRRARRTSDDGPRATFGQLLPFLFEHKRTLVVVAVLSILSAVTMLVQPLLVGQVIDRVQNNADLGILLWALVGFVIAAWLLGAINASGFIQYAALRLNYRIFAWGVGLAVLFGLISGVYPAWRMSRLHPVQALKGATR